MKKNAFTLAEVMITLTIIGVVAAICIPSVVANTQQEEYKTGLKKAISVLNSAITMNTTVENETPYDNSNLFGYLQRHMSILTSMANRADSDDGFIESYGWSNAAFYTTDGMRFEFRSGTSDMGDNEASSVTGGKYLLYESEEAVGEKVYACTRNQTSDGAVWRRESSDGSTIVGACGGCGSYGLKKNPYNTQNPPCLILVDINGNKKPNPQNANCKHNSPDASTCGRKNVFKYAEPDGKRLTDLFPVLITESAAIPYGTAAQKAMYNGKQKQ